MIGDEYRVRVVSRSKRTWLTAPMTAAAADTFMREAAESLLKHADGPRLLAFPDENAPVAFIRAREVESVELVPLPIPGPARGAAGPSIGASA